MIDSAIRRKARRGRVYVVLLQSIHGATITRGAKVHRMRPRTPQAVWEKARISYRIMVEAGGIEPPSEDRPAMATTRVVRDLISPPRRPRTGFDAASRFEFRDSAQPANRVSLAH